MDMKNNGTLAATFLAFGIAVAAVGAAAAHGMQGGMDQMGSGMMMGSQMMQGGMGPGMMGPGIGSGADALFGTRVTPMMNLSVEDVRGYLAMQIERLNNKRLKVGEVKADGATITADVVTLDNSLVQRLKVDRRTGAIEYQN